MFVDLFAEISRRASPDKIAVRTEDDRAITFAQLLAQSGQIAHALRALGVQPGDRVAVQVEKSVAALALYLASLRAGAVFLPLNTAYTLAEIGYFVGDAQPALIVCDPRQADAIGTLPSTARIATLDAAGNGTLTSAAGQHPSTFPDTPRGEDDLAAILYTSGTTGRSKGAMLTQGNLLSNALTLIDAWRFTADDVLIHALPIFHVHGLFVATNIMLLAGGTMIFLPKFDADQVARLLPEATALMGVPTFYTRLVAHPGVTRDSTRRIRLFVSGSAPLLADTHRQWHDLTGHAILERYGMTETGMNTSNPHDGDRIPGSVGPALPGVDVRVVDPETGVAMLASEIGMIEVRGPNVFKGYWQMPEKTAAEFRPDGFFITGDLGTLDDRGYIRILGRGKDLVITGGFNVYPKEIEEEIDALPGVVESAVIGLPHADFGEGVTAVVVGTPSGAPDEAAVLAALAPRLAKFKQPKRVLFVPDLPRNTMGKVQKNVLRDRYRDLYAT